MSAEAENFNRAHNNVNELADAAQSIKHIRFGRYTRSEFGTYNPFLWIIEIFQLLGLYATAGYYSVRAAHISADPHIAEHIKQYRDEIPERVYKLWYGLGCLVGGVVNIVD